MIGGCLKRPSPAKITERRSFLESKKKNMQNKLFEVNPNGKRPPCFDRTSVIIKLKSEDTSWAY